MIFGQVGMIRKNDSKKRRVNIQDEPVVDDVNTLEQHSVEIGEEILLKGGQF